MVRFQVRFCVLDLCHIMTDFESHLPVHLSRLPSCLNTEYSCQQISLESLDLNGFFVCSRPPPYDCMITRIYTAFLRSGIDKAIDSC